MFHQVKMLLSSFFILLAIRSDGSDTTAMLAVVKSDLEAKSRSVSEILSDQVYMPLHSLTSFRQLIRKFAPTGEIEIVTAGEPGLRTDIHVEVTDASGKTVPNALMYFYQTDHKGWYADTNVHILINSGDFKYSRLFGYAKTDRDGKILIHTIRPNGYPRSDLAAHIHIHFWDSKGNPIYGTPGELQFDDDPRMTLERRARSKSDGYLIGKNEGSKNRALYKFKIELPAD